jgi:hypothetical protein
MLDDGFAALLPEELRHQMALPSDDPPALACKPLRSAQLSDSAVGVA